MSAEGVLDSSLEPTSYDDAARLLSLLCPDFIKNNVEYGLNSPESFACLLYRNKSLFEKVKVAFAARDFHNLWDRCVRIRLKKPLKGYINAADVLDSISSNLTNLVNGRIDTPLWRMSNATLEDTQTFVKEFTLCSLMEQKRMPSMLFYELGSFRNNPTLNERVQKLFCMDQNTFLVNASATGKTRLLYEGLYQHWGIYITAHADDQEAQALQAAMGSTFGCEDGMVEFLPNASALGYRELLDDNLEFLNRRFSIVLLVHLLVFREFLKTAYAESVIDDQNLRRLWLLAQLWRPCLGGWNDDVHRQLLQSFEWEPSTVINNELTKVKEEVNSLLPDIIRKEGLFVAVDEANIAARLFWRDAAEKHPPIRSIIRVWRDQLASLDCPVTFVVAGTEISPEAFPSSLPEWSSWKWTSDTGSFDDRDVQRNYIIPFLPPSFPQTPSGVALLERIWKWCRPRHRLTTVIIRMLIEDKGAHPHGVLNRYIKRLMTYDATDGAEFIAEEGPCKIEPFFNSIDTIVQSNFHARSATHEVVFHYIMTGKHPPSYDISRLALVTSGVGEFKDKDMRVIAMDQPGLTIAAAIWLGNDRERVRYEDPDVLRSLRLFKPFSFFFNLAWPNGDNYSSAGYIALYLSHAFVGGRAMSDVFAVSAPLWLEDISMTAYLAVLRKDKKGVVEEMLVGPSELFPTSPPLGYRASTCDDVIAWFRQERIGAFCLCPPDCWADLIFVLKLNGKYVWVVLRAAGQGIQLETKDLYLEFERLTENNLFSRRATDTSDITEIQNRFSEALQSLPNALAPPGSFPMLRVLASFPHQPVLPHHDLTQRITGRPVSVLKLDTFTSVTEVFSPESLVEGLISSMHDKRSSYSDDSFAPINSVSSSRAGKQKDKKPAGQLPTRSSSPRNAASRVGRPIRPISRHKMPPSTLIAEPAPLNRQIAKEVEPTREFKRARKEARGQPLPVPLRRSPRGHATPN